MGIVCVMKLIIVLL